MSEIGTHRAKSSSSLFMLMFIAGLAFGGIIAAFLTLQQINALKNEISGLKNQVSDLYGSQNLTYQNITLFQDSTALANLYANVKDSVVLISGTTSQGIVQGSGFVYNFSGAVRVVTNYHVVHDTINRSVTFPSGNGYAATVNGTDPYADLAVLWVDAPESEFKPLEIVGSSTLKVGEPVIAIGNPYGLVGSLTTGVVSALGRTITEEQYTGGFSIANIIQTSTPINPGNSGGPLLNYLGKVVGITTAIVENSQGLGFAIPSNTILREIHFLITYGSYNGHSYLGVAGNDMDYEAAQTYHTNVTYGWRIAQVTTGGPAGTAGVEIGDIIIGINGTIVRNMDEMSSYLEENTLPTETAVLSIARNNQTLQIPVVLDKRPPPPV
jgi:S1-C subfamily serine protease